MKKFWIILVLASLCASVAVADFGFFGADRSWIVLDINGTSSGYSLWDDGIGTFQGANLGTFDLAAGSIGTLSITGYDTKTWKNGSGDVWGTEYYYAIYLGDRPEVVTFTAMSGGWLSNNGNDQTWGNANLSIDLLESLTETGTYTLEIYGRIQGSNGAGSYYIYDNGNSGSNYSATFVVMDSTPGDVDVPGAVPEPATVGLYCLGGIALLLRRRVHS